MDFIRYEHITKRLVFGFKFSQRMLRIDEGMLKKGLIRNFPKKGKGDNLKRLCVYHNIYKPFILKYNMTNQIERMKRIRMILDDFPTEKTPKKKLAAILSLRYGVSIRTINDYLETLIDAEKLIFENKLVWLKND